MHIPVLKKEVIEYLEPGSNENFIDATIGAAGHTLAILEKNKPEGKVLGIDQSIELIKKLELKAARRKLQKRLILACDNFVKNQHHFFKAMHNDKINSVVLRFTRESINLQKAFIKLFDDIKNFINQSIKDGELIKKLQKLFQFGIMTILK